MREWELDPETYSGEVVTELKLMLRVCAPRYIKCARFANQRRYSARRLTSVWAITFPAPMASSMLTNIYCFNFVFLVFFLTDR